MSSITLDQVALKFPVGTKVKYFPILGLPSFTETHVTSEPWDLCGSIVVKLHGKAGGFDVEHLEVINESPSLSVVQSEIKELIITGADNLDPITVILKDISKGKGKIIVECYGKSWSAYWGGMGNNTIAEFFSGCDSEYIIGYFSPHMKRFEFDAEAFRLEAQKAIVRHRRNNWSERAVAREVYDLEDWSEYMPEHTYDEFKKPCDFFMSDSKWKVVIEEVLNEIDIPECETSDFKYLSKIIHTVQLAIKEHVTKSAQANKGSQPC